MSDVRADELAAWARSIDPAIPGDAALSAVSDDASFRRYFRFDSGAAGLIFVDAPPEQEDSQSFARVSAALAAQGLNCPVVTASHLEQGFMAVTDLGDQVYLKVMVSRPQRISALYDDARAALVRMLRVECDLPPYDESRLRAEMALFTDWFLPRQLGIEVSDEVSGMLQAVSDLLVQNALSQPQRFVHRDYHCRNLMVTPVNSPGILDFQDAVIGPVTYDLVSLYKDCYYRFDRAWVEAEVQKFHGQLVAGDIVSPDVPFLEWFDLMGAQRHLKCAGIFSRLNLRDGKPGYLGDIPLVIDYLVEVARLYPKLESFGAWLEQAVVPGMQAAPYNRVAAG